MKVQIIYEDKQVIVAHKPCGMPSQADKTGDMDMVTYLSKKTGSEIFIINRIDRPVEGLLVFAKDKKVSANLSSQLAQKSFSKTYYGVVSGNSENIAPTGTFVDYLLKDERKNISKVVNKGVSKSKEAVLNYKIIGKNNEFTLVKIDLETGRHHQIRVQFSQRNLPLLGDSKYGGIRLKNSDGICLCSCQVKFYHPIKKKNMEFSVFPEKEEFKMFQNDSENLFS